MDITNNTKAQKSDDKAVRVGIVEDDIQQSKYATRFFLGCKYYFLSTLKETIQLYIRLTVYPRFHSSRNCIFNFLWISNLLLNEIKTLLEKWAKYI